MRTVSLVLVSSFVVTALSAGTALAERKTYSGASCLTTGADVAKAKRDSSGRVLNDSATATAFVCPLDTRTEFAKSGIVYVNDARTNAEVTCTMLSQDREGDNLHSLQRSSGSQAAGRSIQLGFENGLEVSPNGFVFYFCSVPGKNADGLLSGIDSYVTHED